MVGDLAGGNGRRSGPDRLAFAAGMDSFDKSATHDTYSETTVERDVAGTHHACAACSKTEVDRGRLVRIEAPCARLTLPNCSDIQYSHTEERRGLTIRKSAMHVALRHSLLETATDICLHKASHLGAQWEPRHKNVVRSIHHWHDHRFPHERTTADAGAVVMHACRNQSTSCHVLDVLGFARESPTHHRLGSLFHRQNDNPSIGRG